MPSFFGRRYMRGQPRRTERLVGALVLVLLMAIVGLFALTGGLFANVVKSVPVLTKAKDLVGISEKPLFVAEAKNAKPAEPPLEMREAEALLPVPGDTTWRRDGILVASTGMPLPETFSFRPFANDKVIRLINTAEEYGGAHVYAATYNPANLKPGLAGAAAYIVDCGSPESAFGLWRATRPADSKVLALGSAGWSSDRGGWADNDGPSRSFWAGRFVTYLLADSKKSEIDWISRLLSSVQINYGGPFWSESVLPREGQVERSFRYIKKNALGIDALSDCWLADYHNGLTIGVMQPVVPEKMLSNLKQRAATQPADSHAMSNEALAASAVAFKVADRAATAFEAGPYVFVIAAPPQQIELVSATAKMLHDRWSGIEAASAGGGTGGTLGQASAGTNPQAAGHKPQAAPATGIARFAEIGDDVIAPTKTERFTDNLYEKIDGREPMFRSFGFVELRFGQYLDNKSKQSFDVYLYDMGEPNNTLGIFMKERSNAQASAGIGRDSYVSGANIYFWKGKYYVNVLGPADGGDAPVATAKKIAAAIAETIADTGSGFWAEDVLPKEDRIPESFKYIATSALSYDFLNRVYRADYKAGGKTFGLFAKKSADAKAAHDLFIKLADASKKYGDVVEQRVDTPGSELLVSRSIDVYMVAFSKGVFLGGVVDCENKELAIQKAQLLRERMPADAAGEPEPASQPADAAKSESDGDSNGH